MMFGKALGLGAAVVIAGVTASAASAAPVVVINSSFESPTQAGGTFQDGQGVITGWTKVATFQGNSSAGVQNFGDPSYFQPANGSQVVYINAGGIQQDLGALLANTTYTLTVAAGNQRNYGQGSTGFLGFVNAGGQDYSSTIAVPLLVGSMTDFTSSFTTGASVTGNLFVRLSNRSGDQVLFDNVRVNAVSALPAVPEPATWATMMLGVGAIGAALRRRTRVNVRFA